MGVELRGVNMVTAALGKLRDMPLEKIHRAMGTEALRRIRDRVHKGVTMTGAPMPPSLRAMKEGGITLEDTGQMVLHSMGVTVADKRKTVLAFDADRAKIAFWNHNGAKTRNGKWRPRPRPFFGFGKGDEQAIREAGQDILDLHVKQSGGK